MGNAVRTGTLSDAIEQVTTLDIVSGFDVPCKSRNGKIYLICPGHNDTHFGSCYVDKKDNGYYCYACGEHVDKWNMVLKLNGGKKKEACDWFFRTAGIEPIKEKKENPYKKVLELIRRVEEYVDNAPVYDDRHVCAKYESTCGRTCKGEYLYSELSINNPLLELYKFNRSAFKRIVSAKLKARKARFLEQSSFYANGICVVVENMGLLSSDELQNACEKNIRTIENLITEIDLL